MLCCLVCIDRVVFCFFFFFYQFSDNNVDKKNTFICNRVINKWQVFTLYPEGIWKVALWHRSAQHLLLLFEHTSQSTNMMNLSNI